MYFPTRSASLFVLAQTRLWTEKPAFVLEEDPEHPGDGEDDLPVRNIETSGPGEWKRRQMDKEGNEKA